MMYNDYAFDLGVANYGIPEHQFVNQERFIQASAYLHAQSPIAQYPEPLRSQLIERVSTQSDPLGRITFDVAGTASGNWFVEGVPTEQTFTAGSGHTQLFLGPLQERDDIRIVSQEAGWFQALLDIAVVDPMAPRWEDVTPASGRVWIPLWQVARDGGPDLAEPRGGVLVEVFAGERLRIEWVDTHQDVTEFTETATMYER